MKVEFKMCGERLTVLMVGEIDHHTAKGICEKIDFRLNVDKPQKLVFDFSGVSFMDSSGLAVVLGRKKLCDRIGAKVYVANIGQGPKRILKLAGADKFIEFLED